MKLALSADVKGRHRHRSGQENRNVDQESAQPTRLRSAGGWVQKHAQARQKQIGEIGNQVPSCFSFDWKWQFAAPNPRQKFFAGLDRALGPAMLLRFEAVHVDRQLRRRDNVGKENKFPTRELSAIAQIKVFTKCVVLPTASLFDARLTP